MRRCARSMIHRICWAGLLLLCLLSAGGAFAASGVPTKTSGEAGRPAFTVPAICYAGAVNGVYGVQFDSSAGLPGNMQVNVTTSAVPLIPLHFDEASGTAASTAPLLGTVQAIHAMLVEADANGQVSASGWSYDAYGRLLGQLETELVAGEDGVQLQSGKLFDGEGDLSVIYQANDPGSKVADYAAAYDESGNLSIYGYHDGTGNGYALDVDGNVLGVDMVQDEVRYVWTEQTGWLQLDPECPLNVLGTDAPKGFTFRQVERLVSSSHWYPDNTIGAAGLPLRDEYPDLTDKWYNIVPVDLSIQGRQVIPLVASAQFVIGQAVVTVDGDSVTVSYTLGSNVTEVVRETLRWFTSPGEITKGFCNSPHSDMKFDRPISIEKDLGGRTIGLLFICIKGTYYENYANLNDAPNLYRQYEPEWVAWRDHLHALLRQVESSVKK